MNLVLEGAMTGAAPQLGQARFSQAGSGDASSIFALGFGPQPLSAPAHQMPTMSHDDNIALAYIRVMRCL